MGPGKRIGKIGEITGIGKVERITIELSNVW